MRHYLFATNQMFSLVGILGLSVNLVLLHTVHAQDEKRSVKVKVVGLEDNAARVSIATMDGKFLAPAEAIVRKTSRGVEYFYTSGEFSVEAPSAPVLVIVTQGLESTSRTVLLKASADSNVEIRMQRWIDMSTRGWYSGDSHIHLQTGGPLAATIEDALLAARAEGLNYSNLCVSNNLGDDIRGRELITGGPHAASTNRHLLVFGEEMRSSIYGHMQFFGIRRLVEPQYTGFDNTPNHLDFPANYALAQAACDQGGLVTYGHPMLANAPEAFGADLIAPNGAARELPIDAVLGVVHAMDVMSYNSDERLSSELWYRLLNCGLRISACVGTDALLDQSTDPVGGSRVYVQLDGPLTMPAWIDGLRSGRSLVTNGPIPFLKVDGELPGATCKLTTPRSVRVQATVESQVAVDKLEIIVNGEVVRTEDVSRADHVADFAAATSESAVSESVASEANNAFANKAANPDVQHCHFEFDLPVERSCWIALRVQGPDDARVFDGPAWGHTGPVYVELDDRPISSPEDAKYFVEWIEQMIRVVVTRNRYPSLADREAVEQQFRKAQDYYRQRSN